MHLQQALCKISCFYEEKSRDITVCFSCNNIAVGAVSNGNKIPFAMPFVVLSNLLTV